MTQWRTTSRKGKVSSQRIVCRVDFHDSSKRSNLTLSTVIFVVNSVYFCRYGQ